MGIRGAERESENRRAEQKWRNGGAERGRGSEKRSGSRKGEERNRGAEQRSGTEERSSGAKRRCGTAEWSGLGIRGYRANNSSEGTRFIKTSFARPGVLPQFTLVVRSACPAPGPCLGCGFELRNEFSYTGSGVHVGA